MLADGSFVESWTDVYPVGMKKNSWWVKGNNLVNDKLLMTKFENYKFTNKFIEIDEFHNKL